MSNEVGSGLDPSFVFNPIDPAFVADPYPTYALLREKAPVYTWPFGGSILLTKFSDVAAALRDQRLSTNAEHWEMSPPSLPDDQKPELQRLTQRGLLLLNGADHARVRRLVGPAFTAKAVERMRGDVEAIVNDALAGKTDGPAIDIAEIADFIPLRVISRVLGIPKDLDPEFRRFGSAIIDAFDPFRSQDELIALMGPITAGFALVRRVIGERRSALGDDLLSTLIRAEEAGDQLSEDELLATVAGLIVGGAETTVHFISFAVFTLLQHPDALAALQAEPALMRGAIDEILRYDSFVKMGIARYALEDVEIRGVRIPKGKMIIPLTASANRDPDAFTNPDVFDIRRGAGDHLTFGAGPHLCLGASLARLEVEVTLSVLLQRFPSMRLASGPVFAPHSYLRKVGSLTVELRPR